MSSRTCAAERSPKKPVSVMSEDDEVDVNTTTDDEDGEDICPSVSFARPRQNNLITVSTPQARIDRHRPSNPATHTLPVSAQLRLFGSSILDFALTGNPPPPHVNPTNNWKLGNGQNVKTLSGKAKPETRSTHEPEHSSRAENRRLLWYAVCLMHLL